MSRQTLFRVSEFALLFALVAFTRASPVENLGDPKNCDGVKCAGPVMYYQALGCTPVFKNPTDCCAMKYDCSKIQERSKNKCYVNGHEYDIGESLKDEDKNPCDIGCTCRQHNDVAGFTCAVVDCFMPSVVNDKCFYNRSSDKCCAEYTCLEEGQTKATCNVDGKIYQEGDYFEPKGADPDLSCTCLPGYNGENVEPFCRKPKRPYCDPSFRNAGDVFAHCAPVYYSSQSPLTDCSVFSRCQTPDDVVIHEHNDEDKSEPRSGESNNEDHMCQFGDMKMRIGDKLNVADCVSCMCEVPPVPTCQRIDCN